MEGLVCEGMMGQSGKVQLGVDVSYQRIGREGFETGGVSDAALEVTIEAELEGGVEGGLS